MDLSDPGYWLGSRGRTFTSTPRPHASHCLLLPPSPTHMFLASTPRPPHTLYPPPPPSPIGFVGLAHTITTHQHHTLRRPLSSCRSARSVPNLGDLQLLDLHRSGRIVYRAAPRGLPRPPRRRLYPGRVSVGGGASRRGWGWRGGGGGDVAARRRSDVVECGRGRCRGCGQHGFRGNTRVIIMFSSQTYVD